MKHLTRTLLVPALLLSIFVVVGCLLQGDYSTKYMGVYPRDTTVTVGGTAKFHVYITCGEPCGSASYQWQKDGVDLEDGLTATGTVIQGAAFYGDGSLLELVNVHEADSGTYSVLIGDSTRFEASHLTVVAAH